MKRKTLKFGTLLLAAFFLPAAIANATTIINGGFETGDLTGWTVSEDPFFANLPKGSNVYGAGVVGPGGWPFFVSQPSEGSYAFLNVFDGGNPTTITLKQDINVTADTPVIAFDYRAAWAIGLSAPATQDRSFSVNIVSGGADHRNLILTTTHGTLMNPFPCSPNGSCNAPPGTTGFEPDTGLLSGLVDLTPFIGMNVSLIFEWQIPESMSGPAFFQLDNVREVPSAPVPEPSTMLLLGSGLVGLLGYGRRRMKK